MIVLLQVTSTIFWDGTYLTLRATNLSSTTFLYRKEHLIPFLPSHPIVPPEGTDSPDARPFGVISAAPYGSAAVLCIPWAYIKMMGARGLRKASEVRCPTSHFFLLGVQLYLSAWGNRYLDLYSITSCHCLSLSSTIYLLFFFLACNIECKLHDGSITRSFWTQIPKWEW